MPEKVSINATLTKQNGKTTQKAITDINPNASASAITDFVTELFGLTTNIYAGADRISKMPVSEFVPHVEKPTPTISLNNMSTATNGWKISYTAPLDATLTYYVPDIAEETETEGLTSTLLTWQSNRNIFISPVNPEQKSSLVGKQITVILAAIETDTYAATSVSKTFTLS